MKKMVLVILICSVMISMAFSSGATEAATAQPKDPIRIGFLFARSGALGLMGEESLQAGLIAVEQINARGGINGRMIEPVIADVPDTTAA